LILIPRGNTIFGNSQPEEDAKMEYTLPVVIVRLENGKYMARCEDVRATATGDTASEAVANLLESIEEMVEAFGAAAVFQDAPTAGEVQIEGVTVAKSIRMPYNDGSMARGESHGTEPQKDS
jgi:predicted RNase H-like HicB family nuclease